jgi:hypothetical protein
MIEHQGGPRRAGEAGHKQIIFGVPIESSTAFIPEGSMTVGATQDAKLKIDNIQAKLDALKGERGSKIARADDDFNDALRAAKEKKSAAYTQIKQDYDPQIAELDEELKQAKRASTHFEGPVKRS